jgi:hypothetical protein
MLRAKEKTLDTIQDVVWAIKIKKRVNIKIQDGSFKTFSSGFKNNSATFFLVTEKFSSVGILVAT